MISSQKTHSHWKLNQEWNLMVKCKFIKKRKHYTDYRNMFFAATLVGWIGDSVFRKVRPSQTQIVHKFLASFWYVCLLWLAIPHVYFAKNVAYNIFFLNFWLGFQRLCRLLWGFIFGFTRPVYSVMYVLSNHLGFCCVQKLPSVWHHVGSVCMCVCLVWSACEWPAGTACKWWHIIIVFIACSCWTESVRLACYCSCQVSHPLLRLLFGFLCCFTPVICV